MEKLFTKPIKQLKIKIYLSKTKPNENNYQTNNRGRG